MPAGVVARSCVALMNVTPVAAVPPTRTVAPETKLVPVSVIVVPPAVGPEVGDTEVSVGAGGGVGEGVVQRRRLRRPGWSPAPPSRPPCPPASSRRSCVALTKVTPVAAVPPTRTVAPDTKFVPVSVIVVPPAVGPDVGETDVSVGAGGTCR